MATRRRKLSAGLALLAVAAFVLWPRPDRVTRENFGRIRKGMSEPEVESILGPSHSLGYRSDGRHLRTWFSSDDPPEWLGVLFDASGSVEQTSAGRAKESRWEIGWLRANSRVRHLAGW